jgi:hypothetical protein
MTGCGLDAAGQYRDQWRALLNMVMNLLVSQRQGIYRLAEKFIQKSHSSSS